MNGDCPEYATWCLDHRHVNSDVTVSRYYCETHFCETKIKLQGHDHYEVVGSRELA